MFQFLVEVVLDINIFILCWGTNVQNNDMTPATSQYYVWDPITNKLNPLNCWYDSLLYKKKNVTNSLFSFHFPEKSVFYPASSVPPPSHLTSCTPTKSNLYFDSSFDTLTSEPALCKLLTFRFPNLISIFCHLGHLSKEAIQVQGSVWIFTTILFLWWVVVSPMTNPQVGGPPLVVCPWLLIQCIYRFTAPNMVQIWEILNNTKQSNQFMMKETRY
jgi:hypothetical protein